MLVAGHVSLGFVNVGSSIYHSMQTKVTKRFNASLISVAYTVSKGIGDSEAGVGWLGKAARPAVFRTTTIAGSTGR